MKCLLSLFVLISIISCRKDSALEKAIADQNINIKVERFDSLFGSATVNDLHQLKRDFPFMFSNKYPDTYWIQKMKDTTQQELFVEVGKEVKGFEESEIEIESLFNHLKYYFPEFNVPRVITTTSSVDYRNKVIVTDTIALIAIDNYLGSNHFFYQGIQKFIRKDFEQDLIVVDLAAEYAKKYIYHPKRRTLLDEMVYYGKQLCFIDNMLPNKTEAQRIKYSEAELNWARLNESYIWRFFIERELLYSTDTKLPSRFINSAPFSKFYLESIDTDSPGRIGQYIGWQIVRAYLKNNNVSLQQMLVAPTEEIFNKSKFKPRK